MCGNPLRLLSPVGALFGAASDQRKAQRQQERAQNEAIAAQRRTQADAAKAEANRRRMPNVGALYDQNTIKGGVGSTILTGAGGVQNGLALGRNTLLGS